MNETEDDRHMSRVALKVAQQQARLAANPPALLLEEVDMQEPASPLSEPPEELEAKP